MSRWAVSMAALAVVLSGTALVRTLRPPRVAVNPSAEHLWAEMFRLGMRVEAGEELRRETDQVLLSVRREHARLGRSLTALTQRIDAIETATEAGLTDPALAEMLAAYKQQKAARETVVKQRRTSAERLAEQAAGFGITVDAWRDERAKLDEIDTREERIRAMRAFIERYRGSDMAAEASFDLGVTFAWLTDHKADAEALYRSVIDDYPEALDDRGVPMTAHAQFRLAALLIDQGRLDEAKLLHGTLKADHAGVVHPLGSNTYVNMVEVLLRRAGNSD